jgi:hypothetical protein
MLEPDNINSAISAVVERALTPCSPRQISPTLSDKACAMASGTSAPPPTPPLPPTPSATPVMLTDRRP